MAQVSLDIPVPDAAEVAASYDRILVFRSPDGRKGSFVELTTPTTRLPLSANRLQYRYIDPDGQPTFYYATAFTSTRTGGLSPITTPVQPGGDPALSVLSVQELREQALFGIPTQSSAGAPMTDAFLAFFIRSAVGFVERRLEMCLSPKVVVGEQQPYNRPRVGSKPLLLQLLKFPVQSVQAVRFRTPGATNPITVDARFVGLNTEDGLLTIYAGGMFGLQRAFDSSFYFQPLYQAELLNDAIEVDYLAGYPLGKVPAEIKEMLLVAASLAPLGQLKDQVITPGVAFSNVSGDGFGESVSATNAFDRRLDTYQRMLNDRLDELKLYYRGCSILGT